MHCYSRANELPETILGSADCVAAWRQEWNDKAAIAGGSPGMAVACTLTCDGDLRITHERASRVGHDSCNRARCGCLRLGLPGNHAEHTDCHNHADRYTATSCPPRFYARHFSARDRELKNFFHR